MANEFKFSPQFINVMKGRLKKEVRRRVIEASKEVEDFYLDEVDKFYNEYSPIEYERHPAAIAQERGMAKTYNIVFGEKDTKKQYVCYGALSLNTYHMYLDYNANKYNGHNDWVLWSFLQGYHGLPEPYDTYRGKFRPIIDTKEFIKKKLSKKLSEKIDVASLK